MKKYVMTLEEFILNESNQLNKKFVSACGEGYQTTFSNSGPSITYTSILEFDKLKDAIKNCQNHLKGPKYNKTDIAPGGMPSGYSFNIADVWEVDIDSDVSKFKYIREFEGIKATKIKFAGSSGLTEDDSLKLQSSFIAAMSKENFDKIIPDTKDIGRANDIFLKNRRATDKAIQQLISIKEPVKFIRRIKAIAVSEAYFNVDYSSGSTNTFENGIKNWFRNMYFINDCIVEIFNGFKKKYNIDIDYNSVGRDFKTTLENYAIEELIKMYPNNKI